MHSRFAFPPLAAALALLVLPLSLARGSDLAQEYDQVRKIALRDARVRDAFDRANERLEEKIVELDPALKGYAANHAAKSAPAAAAATPTPHAPAPTPAPRPKPKPFIAQETSGNGTTHVVAAGDTLASLAAHYHVSVASLEAANHNTDPHKLQIGQTLIIPGGSPVPPPAPPPHAVAPQTKNSPSDPQPDNIWDKLKSNF